MEGEESLALVSYLPVRRPPLSLGLHLPFCKTREGERDTYSLSNHPGNPSWRQRCIYLGKNVGLHLEVRNETLRNRLMSQIVVLELSRRRGPWYVVPVMELSV